MAWSWGTKGSKSCLTHSPWSQQQAAVHSNGWANRCALQVTPVFIDISIKISSSLFSNFVLPLNLSWGMWWPNCKCPELWLERSGFQTQPSHCVMFLGFIYALSQCLSLSPCLSPPRSLNGYWQIFRKAWWNAGGSQAMDWSLKSKGWQIFFEFAF